MLTDGTAAREKPPTPYDWYVVGLLFLVSVLGYVDRVILSFLVEPIKAELRLTDAEVGLVTGLAFALLYVFGGLVLGRLIDRGRRVLILAACILIWSLATAATGLAAGFATLFIARMMVGIGEAGLNPAAMGIISRRFAPGHVQKPIGVFTTGLYVGGGLAMMIGAQFLGWVGGMTGIGALSGLSAWRIIFFLVAVPGVVMAALLIVTVRDEAGSSGTKEPGAAPGAAWAFTKAHGKLLLLLAASIVAWSLNNYGLLNWYPAMLMRSYQMSPGEVAAGFGSAFVMAGIAGCFSIHPIILFLRKRVGDLAAYVLCFWAMLILSLCTIVGPLVPGKSLAITMAYFTMYFSAMSVAAVFFLLISLVPAALRGFYTGLYMALVNLTGGAFGSVLVGMLADQLFGAEHLNRAVAMMAILFGPAAAILMYFARREAAAFGRTADGSLATAGANPARAIG